MRLRILIMVLASLCSSVGVESFSILRSARSVASRPQRPRTRNHSWRRLHGLLHARYGPVEEPHSPLDHNNFDNDAAGNSISLQQKEAFQDLLHQVMTVVVSPDPQQQQQQQHIIIPGLLTKHISLLIDTLSGNGGADMIQGLLQETTEQQGPDAAEQMSQILDLMVSFTEDFVEQAAQLDQQNKELLGRILRAMSDPDKTAIQREDELDHILQTSDLSAGFLRHLEGECERITNAPKTTPESARLLETLRILQTRVLEELGQVHLGEAALVLGQLIGYDSFAERMAVLDAGLMVRGVEFAKEMKDLTVEALDGFTRVPGGADPGLVQCIQEIDERLQSYLETNDVGFQ